MTQPYGYPQQPDQGGYFGYPPPPPPPPPPRRTGRTVLTVVLAVAAGVALGAAAGNYIPTLLHGQASSGPTEQYNLPGQPSHTEQQTPADSDGIAAKIDPALVDINTTLGFQQAQAAGTGIVLTADGLVLTNNHVINGATSISGVDIGNGKTYQASVVGYDRSHDIAVIQLQNASGLTTAPIGTSANVAQGDQILAIGNAGGVGGAPSVAAGSVTGLSQSITASSEDGTSEQLTGLIQVAANVQPGDSGGPLVNSQGQVIGVDTAASQGFQMNRGGQPTGGGQGFAIPIDQAMSIEKQITQHQSSATVHIGDSALLGVQVDPQTGRGRRAQATNGALVAGVLSGSPAQAAGIQQGDVVTAINGRTVDSANTLTNLLTQFHPGDRVSVGLLTADGDQTVNVQLAKGPAQ
ncbi:S1C family serine protease [Kutzneria chonburiensis]|uniref:S1C family serine protease n=1 Tax=Kutzneria chonburiensis TaxID=1483604 RepID=A0ABV6N0B9_9PSEU|nr:trypsin-like peptidase domain-containing protein [Kutzneria chonburiensis]